MDCLGSEHLARVAETDCRHCPWLIRHSVQVCAAYTSFSKLQIPSSLAPRGAKYCLAMMPSAFRAANGPHVIFQNFDCQRRFGLPRNQTACAKLVSALTDEERRTLREWEQQILQVMTCSQRDHMQQEYAIPSITCIASQSL